MTSRTPILLAAVAALAVAGGVAIYLARREPTAPPAAAAHEGVVRPKAPPGPNGKRAPLAEPQQPRVTDEWRAELTRKVGGLAQPGEAAFTAYVDLFVDQNLDMAKVQAEREGLTLPEVRALTRLGFFALATQRFGELEDILGRDLPEETEQQLGDLMHELNNELKGKMRELVAKKADESERWQLISATEQKFRDRFMATSGMNPEQLDDLLAGNLLLPDSPPAGSGSTTEPGRRDTLETPARPGTPRAQ